MCTGLRICAGALLIYCSGNLKISSDTTWCDCSHNWKSKVGYEAKLVTNSKLEGTFTNCNKNFGQLCITHKHEERSKNGTFDKDNFRDRDGIITLASINIKKKFKAKAICDLLQMGYLVRTYRLDMNLKRTGKLV